MVLPRHHSSVTLHYKEESLFPILKSEALLKGPDQLKLLKEIRQLLPIPDEYYNTFYDPLIRQFAEFVQVLPLLQGGPVGEMLNLGLERGLLALRVLHELNLFNDNDVLVYALFSGALIQDIGWVTYRRRIMISDKAGFFVKEWLPYSGSLVEQGEYFKIRYVYDVPEGLNRLLNPVFLHDLMPDKGWALLASDPQLLAYWLAWFEGDEDSSGSVGLRLNLVQERLKILLEKRQNPLCSMVNLYTPSESELGEAFWKWFKERIRNAKIDINKEGEGVYRVKEGLLITDDLFKKFASRHAKTPDYKLVKKQLFGLGLASKEGEFVKRNASKQSKQSLAGTPSKNHSSLFKSPNELKQPHQKSTPPAHAPQLQKGYDHTVSSHQQFVVFKGAVIILSMMEGKAPAAMSDLKSVGDTSSKMDHVLGKASPHHFEGGRFNPALAPEGGK